MISRFFTSTITQSRHGYVDDKSTLASIGTFQGHIQQASQDITQNFDDALNITHVVWCAKEEDVKISDVLVSEGRTYTVRRVNTNEVTSTGINQHLEILVEQSA